MTEFMDKYAPRRHLTSEEIELIAQRKKEILINKILLSFTFLIAPMVLYAFIRFIIISYIIAGFKHK